MSGQGRKIYPWLLLLLGIALLTAGFLAILLPFFPAYLQYGPGSLENGLGGVVRYPLALFLLGLGGLLRDWRKACVFGLIGVVLMIGQVFFLDMCHTAHTVLRSVTETNPALAEEQGWVYTPGSVSRLWAATLYTAVTGAAVLLAAALRRWAARKKTKTAA